VQITIDIPAGQEDAVLDAFADGDDRSEEAAARKVTELVGAAVIRHAASAAAREAARERQEAVAGAFGIDLSEQQRGPRGRRNA
jgi:hypothetical protein